MSPEEAQHMAFTAKRAKAYEELFGARPVTFFPSHKKLWDGFVTFSDSDWAQRHTAVSAEDFKREPHRNRFGVLLGRTAHLAYHLGQAAVARPDA